MFIWDNLSSHQQLRVYYYNMSDDDNVAPELRSHGEEPEIDNDIHQSEVEDLVDSNEKLIDEEVYKMKAHRRRRSPSETPSAPAEKQKKKTTSYSGGGKTLDDGTILSDDEGLEQEENFDDYDPETRERRLLESRMDAALAKPKKKRRMEGDDIEQMQDDRISELREKMRQAAISDAECIRLGKPAINKLNMLPEVREVLEKKNLADSILDNNLLEAVRMWLEPLPDASLPAFEIQRALFGVIDNLPIKTIHLRESALGKVVIFYQKSKRPQPSIKRIADRLIGNWTRPIMGRSDNYRDKLIMSKEYNREEVMRRAASSGSPSLQEAESLADASALRRNRARIPVVKPVSYEVAPVNRVAEAQASRRREAQKDDQFKRIRQLMTSNSRGTKSSKKGGVSIEGKELRT